MARRAPIIAIGMACVVLIGACGSSGPSRAQQGRSIAEAAGLPSDVAKLFALAVDGTSKTFTVTYATTDQSGASIQMTITQQPPNRSVEVIRADGTVESTFRNPTTAYQCTKDPQWSCGTLGSTLASGSAADPLSADAVSAAVTRMRERSKDYAFRVETRRLLGVDARCLVTTLLPGHDTDPALGASGTLCLSPTGAVLLVDTPSGKLTATDYRTTVAPDAFKLPAVPDQTASQESSAASSAN